LTKLLLPVIATHMYVPSKHMQLGEPGTATVAATAPELSVTFVTELVVFRDTQT